ncbi:MAG: M23 family metallopeptidase [Rhodospirillales bacterium]|nr:M23 family metallopeptidase [Rhodospirillales bacterium]
MTPLLPASLGLLAFSLAFPAWAGQPPGPQMLMPAAELARVSSGFGNRHDGFHPGIDLAARYGSPVRAALAGKVVYAGWDGSYGELVVLRSDNDIVTRYAHLSRIASEVTVGTELKEGEVLGRVGTTGHSYGPHLHFEVLVHRTPVNPASFLALSGNGGTPRTQMAEAPLPR